MIKNLVLFLSLCLTIGIAAARAGERPVLVELFTSEGCSSCPPADALLAELASRPDVLALSFHVDYWDRLGWKDPFSSHEATQRQERYATLLDLATVYTPQIVVDGGWQAVGSDRADVEHALDLARRDHQELSVTLALDRGQAQIKRGENGGRILSHVDVVRGLEEIARYSGTAGTIAAPIRWNCDRIAVVLQAATGRVLGVAVSDAEPL